MIEGLRLSPEYSWRKVEQVKYRQGHRYRVDGEIDLLTSVTTYHNVIDKPALVRWARDDGTDRMVNRLLAVEAPNLPGEDGYEEYVRGLKADAMVRDTLAMDDGTAAHALIQQGLTGVRPELEIELDDARLARVELAVTRGLQMIEEYGLEVLAIEYAVWHPLELYAGTIDLLGRRMSDGAIVVWDWKRSSGHYPESAKQVVAYSEALRELLADDEPIVGVVAVIPRTKADGLGSVKEVPARYWDDLYDNHLHTMGMHKKEAAIRNVWRSI